MLFVISGIVIERLIGLLLDFLASSNGIDYVYTSYDYRKALIVIPLSMFVSWFVILFFQIYLG